MVCPFRLPANATKPKKFTRQTSGKTSAACSRCQLLQDLEMVSTFSAAGEAAAVVVSEDEKTTQEELGLEREKDIKMTSEIISPLRSSHHHQHNKQLDSGEEIFSGKINCCKVRRHAVLECSSCRQITCSCQISGQTDNDYDKECVVISHKKKCCVLKCSSDSVRRNGRIFGVDRRVWLVCASLLFLR